MSFQSVKVTFDREAPQVSDRLFCLWYCYRSTCSSPEYFRVPSKDVALSSHFLPFILNLLLPFCTDISLAEYVQSLPLFSSFCCLLFTLYNILVKVKCHFSPLLLSSVNGRFSITCMHFCSNIFLYNDLTSVINWKILMNFKSKLIT